MDTVSAARSPARAVAVGFAAGALIALPALMVAFISAGAGHGDYVAARLLFPWPMLLTLIEDDGVGMLCMTVGLLQFPIYGGIFGWSIARKTYALVMFCCLAHAVAAALCFSGALLSFS